MLSPLILMGLNLQYMLFHIRIIIVIINQSHACSLLIFPWVDPPVCRWNISLLFASFPPRYLIINDFILTTVCANDLGFSPSFPMNKSEMTHTCEHNSTQIFWDVISGVKYVMWHLSSGRIWGIGRNFECSVFLCNLSSPLSFQNPTFAASGNDVRKCRNWNSGLFFARIYTMSFLRHLVSRAGQIRELEFNIFFALYLLFTIGVHYWCALLASSRFVHSSQTDR